jgi:hypothetical protein
VRGNGSLPATNTDRQNGGTERPAVDAREGFYQQPGFRMTPHGLYYDSGDEDKPPTWLSPPFEIVAHTRNAEGKDWGLLLRWYDPDGKEHEWAMPHAALGGGAEEIWRTMLGGGLPITSTRGGREKLANYLSTAKSSVRARRWTDRLVYRAAGRSVRAAGQDLRRVSL